MLAPPIQPIPPVPALVPVPVVLPPVPVVLPPIPAPAGQPIAAPALPVPILNADAEDEFFVMDNITAEVMSVPITSPDGVHIGGEN